MGFKVKNRESENEQNRVNMDLWDVGGYVKNVRVVTDSYATFTLACRGFAFYNMRLVEGKNGYFISPPQNRGSNGKWYDQYAVYLSNEDKEDIIQTCLKIINDDKDGAQS